MSESKYFGQQRPNTSQSFRKHKPKIRQHKPNPDSFIKSLNETWRKKQELYMYSISTHIRDALPYMVISVSFGLLGYFGFLVMRIKSQIGNVVTWC